MEGPRASVDDTRSPLRLSGKAQEKLETALAKPDQSYFDHVVDVYLAWQGLVDCHRTWIDRVAERCGLSTERVLKSSLLCVAFHDVGKMAENFQRMMRATNDQERREARRCNYRHEIAALWLLEQFAIRLSEKEPILCNGLLEVMAVAGHHRYLADDYLFSDDRFIQQLVWNRSAWKTVQPALLLARRMFEMHSWQLLLPHHTEYEINLQLSNTDNHNYPYECLTRARGQLSQVVDNQNVKRCRELFTLLKGLLMTADWMASGAVEQRTLLAARQSIVSVSADSMFAFMKEKIEQDRKERPHLDSFRDFMPFQKECAKAPEHVLAIAPTGSGKTEAALLWGLNQIKQGHVRKLFFLMPTMVTANSLQDRINNFFKTHGHKVGLVHSTSDLVRDERNRNEESESDRSDVRANHLTERHFFYPVTVATIDQLLASLFHAGRWPMKTFAAANAAIVIDEVHAYDPHTAGLIMIMLEQLRELGTRFMVMSATMPTDLQNTIVNALEPGSIVDDCQTISVIKEQELLDQARSNWDVCEQKLTQWLTEKPIGGASTNFQQLWEKEKPSGEPQRILIVVNTVKRCQEIAELLQSYHPVCYHSKFIYRDRRVKERHITENRPRLIVATQVVEVSLDIDYDILLTECAPMDALAQRAGRVNRSRRESKGRIVVHPPEEKSEKVYGEPVGILETSWEICQTNRGDLTEQDIIRLVETAYTGRALQEEPAFRDIQDATVEAQALLFGVLDNPRPDEDSCLKTRLQKYYEVSVIPAKFEQEAIERSPRQRRELELKMPIWYIMEHRARNYDSDLPFCEMDYDEEIGAQFHSTSCEQDPSTCMF